MEALPVMMFWAPMMMALRLEAQTLPTVVQMTELERPALRAHCLTGA